MDTSTGYMICLHEWIFNKASERRKDVFDEVEREEKTLASLELEFDTLCKVTHPNIVSYLGLHVEQQKDTITVSILQDMLTSATPTTMYLTKGIPSELQMIRSIAGDVLAALQHLHSNSIVHRDLSHSNVFITRDGVAKLADFTAHKRLYDLMQSMNADDDSGSPSIGAKNLKKFDVWKLGVLLTSLAKGCRQGEDAKVPSGVPPDFQDFLRHCLTTSEQERWNVDQLQGHKFITQTIIRKSITASRVSTESDEDGSKNEPSSELDDDDDQISIPHSYKRLCSNSRLKSEFEVLRFLGCGAFGSVIKVRNRLDSGVYAIKQIQLEPSNKLLNRKITREVMLLSRLNHENVVRYYNSWVEQSTLSNGDSSSESTSSPKKSTSTISALEDVLGGHIEDDAPPMVEGSVEWSASLSHHILPKELVSESSGEGLFGLGPKSESDDILFEHSNSGSAEENGGGDAPEAAPMPKQFMLIQMEFCEKLTLKNAIEEGLQKDLDRLWRLFREIIEGLAHIHQQGMIHRDLKPANIFLDSQDHAKIGDFGLATTAMAPKQDDQVDAYKSPTNRIALRSAAGSMTGQVGTELYTAPESKAGNTYTQKVDIYSLGVIFFEMCYPCETKMERAKNLINIRLPSVSFPANADAHMTTEQIHLVKWLLQHDSTKRPTSSDLLCSDYLPPPVIEEAELNEMLRHTVSNPQSKTYKKLLTSLFDQRQTPVSEYTFDMDDVQSSDSSMQSAMYYDFVKGKLEAVMQLHGAQNVFVPLLLPKCKLYENNDNAVHLMDNSGTVVSVPHDTRVPFARYVARKPVSYMKRYAIERVYRSRKIFGCHPKEMLEFSFDFVTSGSVEDKLPQAEVLVVVEEIISQFTFGDKTECSPYLRMNHFGLVKAILLSAGIYDETDQTNVVRLLRTSRGMSRHQVQTALSELNLSERAISLISQYREVENTLGKVEESYSIIKARGGAAAFALEEALKELRELHALLEHIQFKLPIHVAPCLVHDVNIYNCGLIFEVRCKSSKKTNPGQEVLAVGGSYDDLVNRFRVKLTRQESPMVHHAVGVSFSMEKLIRLAAEYERISYVDSVICSLPQDQDPMTQHRIGLLKALWVNNTSTTSANPGLNVDEVSHMCKECNVPNLLLLKDTDPDMVKIRTFDKDKFSEKRINILDVSDSVGSSSGSSKMEPTLQTKDLCRGSKEEKPVTTVESLIKVNIISIDKISALAKKKIEANIVTVLKASLFKCINEKFFVEVIAVDMNISAVRALASNLNVEKDEKAFLSSVRDYVEKNQNTTMKHYLSHICDRIHELVFETSLCAAFVIYGRLDNSYKIVICPSNCKL